MKISKSIMLPEFDNIVSFEQTYTILKQLIETLKIHNTANYDDAVASHRSFKFVDLVSNSGFTQVDGGKITTNSITANKYNELRNTYVFNGDDSLDATYPFELDFEIVSEMTAIQNVKLSFRIRHFRAYSKDAASGGGSTSGSGGGQTSSAGGGQTSSGTSLADSNFFQIASEVPAGETKEFLRAAAGPYRGIADSTSVTAIKNHTHTVVDHTHTVVDHTHTTPNHTHGLTFGIYEEITTPTINVYIDNGAGYGASIGAYTVDQLDINISAYISGVGFKRVKFTSDVRARIAAWVMCKVDITA
jgi:hypothetical protein